MIYINFVLTSSYPSNSDNIGIARYSYTFLWELAHVRYIYTNFKFQ